ncbi:hypothetical protein D3C76_1587130 [compost metagenome]
MLVDVQPQVTHGRREYLVGIVEQADAATGEFRHHLWIKQHRPAIGRRRRQASINGLLLITDTRSAPGIGTGITVTRIKHRHVLAELCADAGQVRQARLVQRLQRPAADGP